MNRISPFFCPAPLGFLLCVYSLIGCSSQTEDATERNITYVCSETNEVIVGPPQSTPAINPATGRHTLLRGVYCAECKQWYATPASDHLSGNPAEFYCRIHGVPMTSAEPDSSE